MSVLNTLPAPVIQLGIVGKIVNQQQNQPYAQLQAGQEASRELLKAESLRIAGSEPPRPGRKVDDRGKKQGGGQQHAPGQDAQKQNPDGNSEPGPPGGNPWAGNILNVKI